MSQSPWARLTVRAVTPGASYEDQTFDQYLQASTPDGTVVELFDMAPMTGEGLAPGTEILALVAVDPYTGLTRGGADGTAVLAPSVVPDVEGAATVRDEVAQRRWAALTYRGVLPVLVPEDVVAGLGVGQAVSWREANFVLLGWRPA